MEVLFLNGVFAFIAGVLLNFTPCVLPVVPLKVQAVLREIQGNARSRIFAASALLSGSLFFFMTIGILTAYLGWKWGEIFQSKIFLSFLSVFLMLSGIAMLANWSFRLPQAVYKIPVHRYMGAFLTGVLAGILSTPCSGPFLGGVLAYAVTQSAAITIVLFTAIGFGLAFPYVGILLMPQLVKYLPKNGRLGVEIESILAFLLIAGSLFFAQSILPGSLHSPLWWVFAFCVFVWGIVSLKRGRKLSERLAPSIMLAIVLFGIYFFFISPKSRSLDWRSYSKVELEKTLASGKPILLEFTADWCINCKVLEKTTYSASEVIDVAKKAKLVLLKVDMTQFHDEEKTLLDQYGGEAIPYAVLLNHTGEPVQTFSGIFGVETLVKGILSIRDVSADSKLEKKQ